MRDTKITHKQNRKTKIRKLVELLAGNLLFRIARSELGTVSTENKKFVANRGFFLDSGAATKPFGSSRDEKETEIINKVI